MSRGRSPRRWESRERHRGTGFARTHSQRTLRFGSNRVAPRTLRCERIPSRRLRGRDKDHREDQLLTAFIRALSSSSP